MHRAIQKRLKAFVRAGAAHGVQLALGYKSERLGVFTVGQIDTSAHLNVRANTLFDLSSLTKVVSTLWCLMYARSLRRIESLDEPIRLQFPHFGSALKDVTYRDLLNHRSGLPPVFEWTETIAATREEKVRWFIKKLDELYEPKDFGREIYSDVGFMLLGFILEEIFGENQDEIFEKAYGSSDSLTYMPTQWLPKWWMRFMPFSYVSPTRSLDGQTTLQSTVQDPRANWLGGVAGHAGLFGTAGAVELWAKEVFEIYHGKGLRLGDKVLREFIDRDAIGSEQRFYGGFDTPSQNEISQAGKTVSPKAVGHLGYTGCSLWMDLEEGWRVVLLTHRHQDEINPERLKELRPMLHDWLYAEVFSKLGES